MKVVYNESLVFVSVGLSFIGCYLAISLCEQLRLLCIISSSEITTRTTRWYLLIAIALGAVGVWSTHMLSFVATDIYREDTSVVGGSQEQVEVRIHFGLCLVMLAVSLFFSLVGMCISSFDVVFLKTRLEVMELYHPNADDMHGPQLRAAMKTNLIKYVCQKDLGYLITGSMICAVGCVLNHYLCARSLSAMTRVDYQIGTIVASIILCTIAFFVSHLMTFRLLALAPNAEGLRIIASMVMAVGCGGMGYVGLAARKYRAADTYPPRSFQGLVFDKHDVLYPILIISLAIAAIIVVYLLAELRKITHRHLSKLKPHFDQLHSQSPLKFSKLPYAFSWSLSKWKSWQSNHTTVNNQCVSTTSLSPSKEAVQSQQEEASPRRDVDGNGRSEIVDFSTSLVVSPSSPTEELSFVKEQHEAVV